jgi:hypothetical protein
MKASGNISISQLENFFKIDANGNGFSGFIQPGSGYPIGKISQKNECTMYVTNTGSTVLKFYLADLNCCETELDSMILQPGQLVTLKIDENINLSSNILNVTNLHPEKEGSFVILIIDNKKKKNQMSRAMA